MAIGACDTISIRFDKASYRVYQLPGGMLYYVFILFGESIKSTPPYISIYIEKKTNKQENDATTTTSASKAIQQ